MWVNAHPINLSVISKFLRLSSRKLSIPSAATNSLVINHGFLSSRSFVIMHRRNKALDKSITSNHLRYFGGFQQVLALVDCYTNSPSIRFLVESSQLSRPSLNRLLKVMVNGHCYFIFIYHFRNWNKNDKINP